MSISSIVTRGYGTWSTVNKLPTWGYGIGAVVDATPMTGWRSTPHSRSLVNRNEKAVVAIEHSRVVVCYPEVRR